MIIDHNFCLQITDCMDNNKHIIQSQTFFYLLLISYDFFMVTFIEIF